MVNGIMSCNTSQSSRNVSSLRHDWNSETKTSITNKNAVVKTTYMNSNNTTIFFKRKISFAL